MSERAKQQAQFMAAALRHVIRRSEAARPGDDLTPLQWAALRFFALANSLSRTVSGFASYNATSRGTASQVIKQLEERGCIRRLHSPDDGRSAEIRLTEAGEKMLARIPEGRLSDAIADLGESDQRVFARVVRRLLDQCRDSDDGVNVGTCRDCRCLRDTGGTLRRCSRTDRLLRTEELDALCVIHEPEIT